MKETKMLRVEMKIIFIEKKRVHVHAQAFIGDKKKYDERYVLAAEETINVNLPFTMTMGVE